MSTLDRREFLASVAAGVTTVPLIPSLAAGSDAQARPGDSGLAPLAFTPLPLGAIRPAGWLQRQLRIQADGLSGHLDEFWPDVGQSQWFGGTAEGWERAPYWLDGAIPLAWMLDDAPMKARITKYIDVIVTHQRADGWYGPYPEDAVAKRYDMWAILLANKVLAQYHEATGDPRALDAVVKSLQGARRGPRSHAALQLGPVPLVRRAGAGVLRLRADGGAVAARSRPQAARAGRGLRGALRDRRPHGSDAAARPVEVDQARRQHRHGGQGRRR